MDASELRVCDIRSTPLVVLREHDSLWLALDRFTGTGLRHLVVLDDRDGLVGVLDDRLVLAEWPLEAVGQQRRTIGQLLRQTASAAERSPRSIPPPLSGRPDI